MKNDDLDLASITRALTDIKTSIEVSPDDDPNEDCVVQAVQRYRSMLLDYATIAYLKKPKDSKLLEGVTTLDGQLEKSIRDNRKEKSKDKDREDNKLGFNQILEAMKKISTGDIPVPSFNIDNFILSPDIKLVGLDDRDHKIKDTELDQGNALVDIDGNVI